MPFIDPSNLNDNLESSNLTEKKFKIGYWLTVHRPQLYQALIGILLVFDVLLGGYNLYKWADYAIFGYLDDEKMLRVLASPVTNTAALRQHFAPQQIIVESSTVFPHASKTDAVAWVKNPNSQYLVYFDYYFTAGGEKTENQRGFLLPNEEKPVGVLGMKVSGAGEANLEIKNIKWQRIDTHKIKDIPAYINEHLNFDVTNFKSQSAASLGLLEGHASFQITNNTFYNFWQADFWAVLKVGEMPVGIEKIALDQFKSEEKRGVVFNVSASISPNSIQVIPDTDIFNNAVFFK